MSTATQSIPAFVPSSQPIPAAAFEVLSYLGVVAIATLCFLLGWLQPNGAAVLTVLLLFSLIVLAWKNFDQGRHPCFLFLCVLMFFQGGRLLAYCFGAEADPMRIRFMVYRAFNLSRDEAGILLLCLALSAICIYAPCRWKYRRVPPPDDLQATRFLPYLYLLFYAALPIQLFKNYRYFEYIQEHGGYVSLFLNHSGLASSVPVFVRAVSIISFPAFVAIFVIERRKKFLYLTTALYFVTSSLVLLWGSRAAIFGLILALWYVARIKSTKKARLVLLAVMVAVLILGAEVIQNIREDADSASGYSFTPFEFLVLNSASLEVTAVAVKYRQIFAPHVGSYLWHELQDAFVANDTSNYFRGKALAFDVSVFLNPARFSQGHGTGGSYIGEAYVIGGLAGVMVISLLVGSGLHLLHHFSGTALSLFVVAMILPDIAFMPRGGLLDWLSVFARNAISILLLALGWRLYRLVDLHPANPLSMQNPEPGLGR
jgi:oligosaccharide repeat unit polymerase